MSRELSQIGNRLHFSVQATVSEEKRPMRAADLAFLLGAHNVPQSAPKVARKRVTFEEEERPNKRERQ